MLRTYVLADGSILVTRPNGAPNLKIEYSIQEGASPEEAARILETVAARLRDIAAPKD